MYFCTKCCCILYLLLHVFTVTTCRESFNSNRNEYNKFYQNLTHPIHKVLVDGNNSYRGVIKHALEQSPFVFYETDMLLDEFGDILPVIGLLNELKPEASNPQIMVSLRYVNYTTGCFVTERLSDIFFNPKSNLSVSDRAKIKNHVSAIVLDFSTRYTEQQHFYTYATYAKDEQISFTNNLKDFIRLYFGDRALPVGVIYRHDFNIYRSEYFRLQVFYADFVVCHVKLDLYSDFPTFPVDFKTQMTDNFPYYNQDFHRLRRLIDTKAVLIQVLDSRNADDSSLYGFTSSDSTWYALHRAMSALPNYNTTSRHFLKKINDKVLLGFNREIIKWSSQNKYQLIISNSHRAFENENSTVNLTNMENETRNEFIIPTLKTNEMDNNLCELNINLTIWKRFYGFVLVDEKSWWTLTRIQEEIVKDIGNCNGALNNQQTDVLEGIMSFKKGISSSWSEVETQIKNIAYNFMNLHHASLKTMIFPENDVKQSKEIQNFLSISKRKGFKIGCSVDFDRVTSAFGRYYHNPVSSTTFKDQLEKEVCQPIFNEADTFIWIIKDFTRGSYVNYPNKGILNSYSDVSFVREVFMKEFNKTNVLVQFLSNRDARVIANLYEIPIVVPLSHIV